VLGKGQDHQNPEHSDSQQNPLGNPRGEVGQRGPLAVVLQDRKGQNADAHHAGEFNSIRKTPRSRVA
jgi:hypothetical protein